MFYNFQCILIFHDLQLIFGFYNSQSPFVFYNFTVLLFIFYNKYIFQRQSKTSKENLDENEKSTRVIKNSLKYI